MADLRVNLFGKQLAGPVIAASGTFGFGPEYAGIEDLRVLGGISGKGLTLNGQPGNDGERLLETPSGLMNSIGLQNPGVQHFIDHELPAMRRCGTTVWANLGGHTIEENVEGVQKLCAAGIDVLELNISHPVFAVLKAAQEAGDTDKVKKYSSLLYAQAQLIEGLPVDDPAAYAEAVCSLMK